ncbi:hypothetical protein GP486_007542 [Trichoglossum hirsutum]|uniref:Uncharacterized protein n=1 Tax=Trichoglossum hirsutum TaxID=265104 RepID=A0A9P8IJE2_9PEZI|nr:hypothetical protein GP486_007542 [Trichoglossum hirsutum]
MKVSSLHKSVLGLGVFLQTVAALDAVQIWLANTCQGTGHSWIAVDNGDVAVCQSISNTLADGGQSWVPFAAETSFHLLYTAASCPANSPAVIVRPGTITTDCIRFNVGSGNHILSVGILEPTPNLLVSINTEVAGASTAQVGLGEAPSNVQILFGTKVFSFGDITLGPAMTHPPRYTDYQAARNSLRTTWMSGAPVGAANHAGQSTDGQPINYIVQYFNTQGIANPYSQFDAANGNLVPALLERLYYYLYLNNRCQGNINMRTNLGSTVMTVSVSFC